MVLKLALLCAALARAGAAPAPLGASYLAWRGGYAGAAQRLSEIENAGFSAVAFVPTYAYTGRDRIDLESGPSRAELSAAIAQARRLGLLVVVKPHLDPPAYGPRFDENGPGSDTWRARCPWRGYFDVDPMSPDYRAYLNIAFEAISDAERLSPGAAPIRLDLGSELMDSVAWFPGDWERLLSWAKAQRRRRGLAGRLLLSHDFSHHFQIPGDVVERLDPRGRRQLARYIRGLDAVSLSQYMDLTAAMPAPERGKRLPTPEEVDAALKLHERRFRDRILIGALGLSPAQIPPLELHEFGIGRGGLRHPNVWGDKLPGAQQQALDAQISVGLSGLLRYLSDPGRRARLVVLWNTGPDYDLFGWEDPSYGVPDAARILKEGLLPRR